VISGHRRNAIGLLTGPSSSGARCLRTGRRVGGNRQVPGESPHGKAFQDFGVEVVKLGEDVDAATMFPPSEQALRAITSLPRGRSRGTTGVGSVVAHRA
jgi:hypothetical protein